MSSAFVPIGLAPAGGGGGRQGRSSGQGSVQGLLERDGPPVVGGAVPVIQKEPAQQVAPVGAERAVVEIGIGGSVKGHGHMTGGYPGDEVA